MTTAVYNTDFYAWTQQQAALLRNEEWTEVDWQNLIEEIEAMGRSEQRELENRLIVIVMHLLKLQYQPSRRTRSWVVTVQTQRVDVARHLRKNPSLRTLLTETVADIYPDAVKKAAIETRLKAETFPPVCPWTAEQILDLSFLP
ncbi:MAG: DUF29 domain-containing protein [Caldilineaceae bacterium]